MGQTFYSPALHFAVCYIWHIFRIFSNSLLIATILVFRKFCLKEPEFLRRDQQFYTESGVRGGPIIMVQIENEYGNYGYSDYPRDKAGISTL
jgi:hypothetical protein